MSFLNWKSYGKVKGKCPHEILLVLDGSTGQNAYEQAKQFSEVTKVTSMMVTKLDGTAKGGVVIGISDQLSIPIKYIGTGESIDDIQLFDKVDFVESFFKKYQLKNYQNLILIVLIKKINIKDTPFSSGLVRDYIESEN